MSALLNVPIHVLNYDADSTWWNTFDRDGTIKGPGIYLYHKNDEHFDLLVRQDSALANQVV